MRVNYLLPLSLLLIIILPLVIAESKQVDLSIETSVADYDVGITNAAVAPDDSVVLLVGKEGYAHLISAKNPGDRSLDVELNSARSEDFSDVAWHPRGEAALIAGDFVAIMPALK